MTPVVTSQEQIPTLHHSIHNTQSINVKDEILKLIEQVIADGCGSNLKSKQPCGRTNVEGWDSNPVICFDCYDPNLEEFTGTGRNMRKNFPCVDAFDMKSGDSSNVKASHDHHNMSPDQRMRLYYYLEYELPYQDPSAVGGSGKNKMGQPFHRVHNLIARKDMLPALIEITTDSRHLMPMKYWPLSPIRESLDETVRS